MQDSLKKKYEIPQAIMLVERTDEIYIVNMDDEENVFKLSGDISQVYMKINDKDENSVLDIFESTLNRKASEKDCANLEKFINQFCKVGLLAPKG